MLTDKSLRDVLAAFASPNPTPGGGSASAAASAIGTSVLIMVARLPKTRSGSDDERAALAAAAPALMVVQQQLIEAIDADTLAYDRVVSAYKQAKATEQQQAARKEAIQRALRTATDVPLDVMRFSAEALKLGRIVAAHGHRPAVSDVGVAIALIGAGLRGARLNVESNLGRLLDGAYADSVKMEVGRVSTEATMAIGAADASLRDA